MNPGKLRHRITILKKSLVEDEYGGSKEEMVPDFKKWAKVNEETESVKNEDGQKQNKEKLEVVIRYTKTVVPGMSFLFDNAKYIIDKTKNKNHRNRFLVLECSECE